MPELTAISLQAAAQEGVTQEEPGRLPKLRR